MLTYAPKYQTPEQHKWLTKLLGFEFDIVYKPATANKPADALSRKFKEETPQFAALAVTCPIPAIWQALQGAYAEDTEMTNLLNSIRQDPAAYPDHTIRDHIVLFKGRIMVPENGPLRHLLISEFNNTPVGGHAGALRTFHRIASTFHWPSLKQQVRDFIAACRVCQTVKSFNKACCNISHCREKSGSHSL